MVPKCYCLDTAEGRGMLSMAGLACCHVSPTGARLMYCCLQRRPDSQNKGIMHASDLHIHTCCSSAKLPAAVHFVGQCGVEISPAARQVDNAHPAFAPMQAARRGCAACQAGC